MEGSQPIPGGKRFADYVAEKILQEMDVSRFKLAQTEREFESVKKKIRLFRQYHEELETYVSPEWLPYTCPYCEAPFSGRTDFKRCEMCEDFWCERKNCPDGESHFTDCSQCHRSFCIKHTIVCTVCDTRHCTQCQEANPTCITPTS